MRKIFANLKSVVALAVVAAMTLSVSCMYDDTALTKRVDKVEKNLAALTEKVNALGGENASLESLLDGKLVITGVTTDEAGNKVVTLSDGSTITVLAECAGLQYRVVDGVLEISADGETWVAVTAAADCLVKEVRTNEDGSVTLVLADDTEFTSAVAEVIECEATRSAVYVVSGTPKEVRFTINDAVEDINVMNQPFGWSATVEEYVEAPEVEDDYYEDDYEVGPLAAGGKDYVLKINAPSYELIKAGYAATEGVVSVHFNTAAGACKVLKVEVTLAELTLAVDNAGNIVLTSTIAVLNKPYYGAPFMDFANFWFGFMPKAAYEAFLEGDEEAAYEAVYSQRNSGFQNVFELQQYEEGVCEQESYTFSLDEFCQGAFYSDPLPYGVEYVVFVTVDYDKNFEPDLTKAVTVDFVKTIAEARVIDGTETWNDVTVGLSLAGYDNYSFGWISDDEVEKYLGYGYFGSTIEEFLPTYFGENFTFAYGCAWLYDLEPVLDGYAELSQIASLSYNDDVPQINPGTLYHLVLYPFNGTEEELYDHVFVPENLVYCGTFETKPLVEVEFDANVSFVTNEETNKKIDVTATFANTDIVSVAYMWSETSFLDSEKAIAAIYNDYYSKFVTLDENNRTVNAVKNSGYWDLPSTIYLVMVAINADGEYVYIEKLFGKDPNAIDYEVVFTKAIFDNGTLKLTNDTENDFVNLILNPGLTSVVAGDYTGVTPDWMQGGIMPWSSADALEFDAYNSTFNLTAAPASSGQYYVSDAFAMNISVDGDVYTIVATDKPYMDITRNVKYTFTGAIEAPAAIDLTDYTQADSASVGYNSTTGTVRFDFTFSGEACSLQVYPFYGWEDEWHSGEGYNAIENLSIIGMAPTSSKVDIYKQAGSYLVLIEATLPVVGVKKMYFNITL